MFREQSVNRFRSLQSEISEALSAIDGGRAFRIDCWDRNDLNTPDGGGGETRVLRKGDIFESAGVNFSEVYGLLPSDMAEKLTGQSISRDFFATGISLVLHPRSPMVPTTHANFRYLEVADKKWFGGGMDLTPYYLFPEDVTHFHQTIKSACDKHNRNYYPRFKQWCDEYFFLPHRGETRGVGGIFFDYLGKDDPEALLQYADFVAEVARCFLPAYLPVVQRRSSLPYTEDERAFQLVRRGRYVEFNLVYDRGTLFGLRTNGRTESILMSLPPLVSWEYDAQYLPGSREAELISVLKNPQDWIAQGEAS